MAAIFSRLTAPLCVAGGIALQLLREKGIEIHGHLKQVGTIQDAPINMVHPDMKALASIATEPIAMVDPQKRNEVETLVMNLKKMGTLQVVSLKSLLQVYQLALATQTLMVLKTA